MDSIKMTFTIRKATIKDFAVLQKLNELHFQEEFNRGHDPHLDIEWPNKNEGQKFYRQAIRSHHFRTFIAFDKNSDEPLGYIVGCAKNKFSFRTVVMGELESLYVIVKARRKGVAKALVEKLSRWFKEKHVDKMYVSAYYKNEIGHAFYKAVDFVPWDIAFEKTL